MWWDAGLVLFLLQGWALALPQSFTVFKVQCRWSPEGFLGVGTALGRRGLTLWDLREGFYWVSPGVEGMGRDGNHRVP